VRQPATFSVRSPHWESVPLPRFAATPPAFAGLVAAGGRHCHIAMQMTDEGGRHLRQLLVLRVSTPNAFQITATTSASELSRRPAHGRDNRFQATRRSRRSDCTSCRVAKIEVHSIMSAGVDTPGAGELVFEAISGPDW